MYALDVVLEGAVAAEQAFAEDAFKWLQLHVNRLSVIFQMRYRFKRFATIRVSAAERSNAFCVGKKMIFEVLLLLESTLATFEGALELPLVLLQVPIKLALANELSIEADRALEL